MCHVLPPLSPILSLEEGKLCLLLKSSLATVFLVLRVVAQIEISRSRKEAPEQGETSPKRFCPGFQRKVTLIQILWHRCKGLSENASHFVFNIGLYLKPFSCLFNQRGSRSPLTPTTIRQCNSTASV